MRDLVEVPDGTHENAPGVREGAQGAEMTLDTTAGTQTSLDFVHNQVSNSAFMSAIFRQTDTCWTTSFETNPKAAIPREWKGRACLPGDMPDFPERNTYFSVASFLEGAEGRKRDQFAALHVLVLDDPDSVALDPTYLLETSEGNYQAGYRLKDPVTDIGIAKRLHDQLAKAGHIPNDKSGNNAVRYVRLPVGSNTKQETPFRHVLKVWTPELVYSLGELIDGLKLDKDYILHGGQRKEPTGAVAGDVIPEGARNVTLTSLGGTMRHRGMTEEEMLAALLVVNAKRCSPPLDEKDVATIAHSVARYAPSDVPKDGSVTSSAFIGPDKSHCLELTAEPEKREAIVGDLIYATNGVLIAPGGVGKTTLTIHEAVHLILGRDIWQQKVHRPGGVLFITGEDEREEFLRRLYMLMGALNLTPSERQKVMQNFYVEDVTDRIVRLAELDQSGNIIMTPHVDELIERYKGVNLAMINIDPLVYFGAGERLVNDAESVMCQVAKRLSRKLNAHVRLIHHTGKEVARNGTHDQYAGRGGSALADNSRLVMQVIDGESKDFRVPEMAKTLLTMGYQALQVHFHKNSYGRKPPFPVWMMREGWRFHEFNGEPVSETANRKERLDKIKHYLVGKLQAGVYLSKSSLVEAYGDIGVSRNQLRTLVNEALQTGELVERDLPPEKVQGRFQQHLDMPMGKDRERFFVGYQVAE